MKAVLTNLSGVKEVDGGIVHHVKAGSRWPMTVGYTKAVDYYPFPFYLAYSAALLKRDIKEIEVTGVDGVVNDYTSGELFSELVKIGIGKEDILIVEVTLITLKDDLAFLEKVKEEFKCVIILCGVYASIFRDAVLKDNSFIDYAIYGEYELSLKLLVQRLVEGRADSLNNIEGLITRGDDGGVKSHSQMAKITDLAELPFPDRNIFPPALYADFSFHSPCVAITATRGCPAGCIYCVERHAIYNSPRYRMRPYKDVVDEMEHCIEKYGAKQFYFDDMSFVVNKKYVKNICNEILKRKMNIPWTCMGDAMFVDYDTLEVMAKAGCIGMKFGVESADEKILERIGKPLNLDKARQVVKWCQRLGIFTHATFCLGLPGETETTIRKTVRFIKTLKADTAQVSKAVPYPGTPMYEWAKKEGYIVTDDLESYDGSLKSVLSYPQLTGDKIDQWYGLISKKLARNKIYAYLKRPMSAFQILYGLYKEKGLTKTVQALSALFFRAV
ncbi:hypothetical protein MNBD_NITROSPINAE02-1763 [hydrothermal vent metagenome]|uniref:Radical SAM core domain-containing protein n=1 Tax=hydrothermal vent metagenome TaxID=652676 RepID=A0A3B1BZH7_9ZZZZ